MKRNKIIRWFFNKLYHIRLPSFVQYWKTGDKARAKLTTLKDGAYGMVIEGEKYPLMGFPRGPVLFGPLAKLKFMIKNYIFNEVWRILEEGTNEEAMEYVKNKALPIILEEIEKSKYHFFPVEKMCPMARELWRALTKIEERMSGEDREQFKILKEGICFYFQEDDAYRFRLQWIAKYINPKNLIRKIYRFFTHKPYSFKKEIELVLNFMGEAEIVPDMKGRAKLIKRVLLSFLEDKDFGELIENIVWELNWKKLRLSAADIYFFRGKYFKCDWDHYDY